MATYFISDIHLNAKSALQQGLLLDFLHEYGPDADAIYILGDLFALWLGDDLAEGYAKDLFSALRKLSAMGVPLFFMRGNRDFLIGSKFARLTGCKILRDPCIIQLYSQPVLVTHGDQLCTLDKRYQRFRSFVQNPLIKWLFLSLPKSWRQKLGSWIRDRAQSSNATPEFYDVDETTINKWFQKSKTKIMVHGHTHVPAVHDRGTTARIVLGDWNKHSAKILVCTPESFALRNLLADG